MTKTKKYIEKYLVIIRDSSDRVLIDKIIPSISGKQYAIEQATKGLDVPTIYAECIKLKTNGLTRSTRTLKSNLGRFELCFYWSDKQQNYIVIRRDQVNVLKVADKIIHKNFKFNYELK